MFHIPLAFPSIQLQILHVFHEALRQFNVSKKIQFKIEAKQMEESFLQGAMKYVVTVTSDQCRQSQWVNYYGPNNSAQDSFYHNYNQC